jgi:tetratricopeptide (TPR) repeat protein
MTDLQKPLIYRSLFITVLLLMVYGNTLHHGFVWDDIGIIVNNTHLEKLSNIPKFFISEDTSDSPTGYYRPITYVSFALDRALWGLNPVGYNITNLVLHILVSLLFYRVVATLFKSDNLAFAAALIFSLHPIVGETVNFHAGGRNTLLCACFSLLSLLFYINKRPLPAIACFTLAIFSKEFALLLPAVFFLYERIINREKSNWINYIPYLITITCYLGIRAYVVNTNANLLKSANISDNFWIIPQLVVTYLKNMAFPVNLKTLYDLVTPITWSSFIAYTFLLVVLISIVIAFRKRNEILFSTSLFLLFLLPVMNVSYLGTALMADRYAYFALFGFSIAIAYCICLAKKWLLVPIMAVLCAFYITVDIQRNGLWKDEISFFTQMTKDSPAMSTGFQNLGFAYYDRQDYKNAEKYLTIAHTKKNLSGSMLVASASMFLEMNKPDRAIVVLEKKIHYEPNNPRAYIMAGRVYEELGDKVMAKRYQDKAEMLYPGIYEMMSRRVLAVCREGEALIARRKLVQAEQLFMEALKIDPGFVPALIDMGSLVAEKGDPAKSVHYFARAAALEPLNPAPHYNLSVVYEALGKKAESQEEMTKFNELNARSKQKGATGRQ